MYRQWYFKSNNLDTHTESRRGVNKLQGNDRAKYQTLGLYFNLEPDTRTKLMQLHTITRPSPVLTSEGH